MANPPAPAHQVLYPITMKFFNVHYLWCDPVYFRYVHSCRTPAFHSAYFWFAFICIAWIFSDHLKDEFRPYRKITFACFIFPSPSSRHTNAKVGSIFLLWFRASLTLDQRRHYRLEWFPKLNHSSSSIKIGYQFYCWVQIALPFLSVINFYSFVVVPNYSHWSSIL